VLNSKKYSNSEVSALLSQEFNGFDGHDPFSLSEKKKICAWIRKGNYVVHNPWAYRKVCFWTYFLESTQFLEDR